MSLRVNLVGSKIRFLKSALQFLAKVGDAELTLEAVSDKLILRSINSTKSAYASVSFDYPFFDAYELLEANVVQAGLTMKYALALFRSQRINKMTLEHKKDDDMLSVTVLSENGLQKQYRLPIIRTDVLQAAVEDSAFPVCVIASANELNSFQTSLDEITIIAMPETEDSRYVSSKAVQIQSYVDPGKDNSERALRTQLELDTQKVFLGYENTSEQPADVTFNLKDFKAMLSLCEAMSSNVAIRFDTPGNPLVVKPHLRGTQAQELEFTAVLVLATLRSSQFSGPSPTSAPNGVTGDPPHGPRRTPANARTPNVPGDTPWHPAGVPGSGTPAGAQGAAARPGEAQTTTRPSRFAQEAGMMPPAPPQFDADTPLRGPEAPHAPEAPSARTARPSARFFDSEAEFAASPPPHADNAPAHMPQTTTGQPHDLRDDGPTPSREEPREEGQEGAQWWEINQPNGHLTSSLGYLNVQGDYDDDADAARLANMPPIRSRYRAMLPDDDEEDDDEEAVPGTPLR